MDDMERTVDDGINTFKCLTKDARFVPGAGATEIELAKELTSYAEVRIYMYHTHSHTSHITHPPHTRTLTEEGLLYWCRLVRDSSNTP